jgi:hypothetical protein
VRDVWQPRLRVTRWSHDRRPGKQDDREWLPLVLGGGALSGYFLFRGQSAIVRQRMQPAQADEIARADAQVRALLPVAAPA